MAHGVLYPETGRRPFGHHDLADPIAADDSSPSEAALVTELRDEIDEKKPDMVIVSSEALQGVAPDRLASVFPPHETTVVLYIREQVDYLMSGYAQRIQATDLCIPFEEYVEQHRNAVDYLPWLRRFENTFGRSNLIVQVYDRDLLVGGSTLTDFLSALGLGDLPIEEGDGVDANPSLDFESLRLKLLANGLGLASTADIQRGLYRVFQQFLQEPRARGAGLAIPASLQGALRKDFAKSNRKVFSRYVRSAERQFRYRDLSSETGRRPIEELSVVFEIVDSWVSVGGLKLMERLQMAPAVPHEST
ncbi:hypothetical protein N8342_05835 [Acidimicrobiales bacterium]|nr:hypothetical protein [bacterium]MDC1389348.1 hypothetical protein [Acidimicrobiales bacterium]